MSDPKKSVAVTMLASLGAQAATFPVHLDLQRLDGEMVRVTVTCKTYGKKAWAKMRREHMEFVQAEEEAAEKAAQAAAAGATADGAGKRPIPRVDEILERGMHRDSLLLARIAQSWSLPDECDADGLERLEDEFGGALNKLLEGYERAVYQGQLGNSGPSRER